MTNTSYKEQIEKIIRSSPSWNDGDPRTQSERIMEILDLAVAEREKEIKEKIKNFVIIDNEFKVGAEEMRHSILNWGFKY